MSRPSLFGTIGSVLVHAVLLLFVAVAPAPPTRADRPKLDTITVRFEPPKPPPPPPKPLVPTPAPSATGEGRRVVRRAEKPAVSETRRPSIVEPRKPAPRPSTPAPSRENATRRYVPPVNVPRTTPTPTPTAERVAPQTPPRTDRPADGTGATSRPDATRDGGGRVGREGTAERAGGDPNGRDGAPPGVPGTGNDPARGTGGGVDLSGFAGRRLTSRPTPRNTAGATVTLVAEICAAPDGSVRVSRWTRVGNPELQREAAATLARWHFASLPDNVPQEAQCGSIRLRFVAN